MPNVLWLERNDALALLRQRLDRSVKVDGEAGIVVAQDPPPDADVSSDPGVVIVLGVPALSLAASNPNPSTDEQVTFSITLDPPPARPASIYYHFVWDDGSEVSTAEPQTARRFSEARTHTVAAYAVINDRWTTGRTAMRLSVAASPPATVTMPQLLWLERNEADALLAPLQLRANIAGQDGVVLGQSIAPGSEVAPGSVLTITLALPKLTLSTPAVNPSTNDEVAFNLTFDPPPPFPPKVTYRIQWPDGTGETVADQATVTHRFSNAGSYDFSATAVINDRWEVESNSLTLSVAGQPIEMPQLPWLESARLSLSSSTVDPRVNDEVTFKVTFDPPPPAAIKATWRFQWNDGTADTLVDQPVAAHRFSAAGTYVVSAGAVINDRWTIDGAQLSVSVFVPPAPIPWLAILLVAAALIVAALLFRVLRPKAVIPSPQPPPAVSIRSGLGSTSHTIEHPEQIRNGLSVRLRHGIRSAVTAEGGADA
ncbi:MAG TPA: PASTA domain-containing protein [Thermoanaerobaculia bacterium]|nr:PASTA domain-containing protein [Thermoanaerobaculia bacterium]